MKRPLYYLLCAIACTSMVGATMPMAAIADAIQPQETAELQSQAGATNGDTGKTEDGTNTSATADTIEDSTATSCVSSRGFEQKEHRKLSSLSIGSAHAF